MSQPRADRPSPAASRPDMAGQDAWRIVTRLALVCLAVALVAGLAALAAVAMTDPSTPGIPGGPALPVLTTLGTAQLGGLVAALLAGVAYVSMLRGRDPVGLVEPLRRRLRIVGIAQIALTVVAAIAWLVAAPNIWVLTLCLALVSAQAGIVLVVAGREHPLGRRPRR